MANIELENVSKVFSGGIVAVDDVTLEIGAGEFVVLVGPSGCGKSTLLRMIAGLEEVSAGRISIDGQDVTDLAPRSRDIAMVFQSYALYPHMTVRQNIGYGLKVRRAPKEEAKRRVAEVAELLGLEELLDRRPAHLSGGQRQRVAMGRAIVREPKAFLMDEPLSNLDAKLRVGMRASLSQLHRRLGTTTVYVTHDQTEAMTLGQRVAVLRDGRILQVDTPQRLYHEPRDVFVAAFIGTPTMNLVQAVIDGDDAVFGRLRIRLDPARRPPPEHQKVTLGIRPEAFEAAASAPAGSPTIEVEPAFVEELGSDAHVFFPVDAARIGLETGQAEDDEGTLLAQEQALFGARVDPRVNAVVGRSLTLAVDPTRFHFFDVETGYSLLAASDIRADEPLPHELTPATP
jgi:multiple sugar transport system ATP-binding protein